MVTVTAVDADVLKTIWWDWLCKEGRSYDWRATTARLRKDGIGNEEAVSAAVRFLALYHTLLTSPELLELVADAVDEVLDYVAREPLVGGGPVSFDVYTLILATIPTDGLPN